MKKKISIAILILLLILCPLIIKSGYIIQTLIMIILYAYWASTWNIVGGFGGQFSLGHATYIGIGAYVSTSLFINNNISPWLGMFIGGLIAGVISIIIGFPTFRLRGSYFTLSTLSLLFVIRIIVTTEESVLGIKTMGAMGLKVPWIGTLMAMQFMDKMWYYYIALILLAIALLVSNKIIKSKMGYYLAAINTNQEAADSLGVNITYYKLKAQFISAFLTAIGGTFYAQLILVVDPSRVLGYDLTVEIAFLAIIGGVATLWGPIIGAVIMVPLNELLRSYLGSQLAGISVLIYGIVMMFIIYYLPGGLNKYVSHFLTRLFSKKIPAIGTRKADLN